MRRATTEEGKLLIPHPDLTDQENIARFIRLTDELLEAKDFHERLAQSRGAVLDRFMEMNVILRERNKALEKLAREREEIFRAMGCVTIQEGLKWIQHRTSNIERRTPNGESQCRAIVQRTGRIAASVALFCENCAETVCAGVLQPGETESAWCEWHQAEWRKHVQGKMIEELGNGTERTNGTNDFAGQVTSLPQDGCAQAPSGRNAPGAGPGQQGTPPPAREKAKANDVEYQANDPVPAHLRAGHGGEGAGARL